MYPFNGKDKFDFSRPVSKLSALGPRGKLTVFNAEWPLHSRDGGPSARQTARWKTKRADIQAKNLARPSCCRIKSNFEVEFGAYRGVRGRTVTVHGNPPPTKDEIYRAVVYQRENYGFGELHPHWSRTGDGYVVGAASAPEQMIVAPETFENITTVRGGSWYTAIPKACHDTDLGEPGHRWLMALGQHYVAVVRRNIFPLEWYPFRIARAKKFTESLHNNPCV